MKKLIVTVSMLMCLVFMFSVTVSAENYQQMPPQNGQRDSGGGQQGQPGGQGNMMRPQQGMMEPGEDQGDDQRQGKKTMPLRVGQEGQEEPIMNPEDGTPSGKMPGGRMMQRHEELMQLRMDIKDKRASNQAELKELRQSFRQKIGSMAGQMREMREIKKENMSDRCKIIVGKISRITSSAQMGIGGRQKAFNAIADRLDKLSKNLAEKGADTTELDAALATLNDKIATLETDYQTFIDKLDNTQQYECGNSQGEFKSETSEAAAAFQQVQKDKLDIEAFLKGDVKSELEALRKNAPSVEPTAEVQGNQ